MGKKSIAFIMTMLMAILLIACGSNAAKKADYTANTAEAALNSERISMARRLNSRRERLFQMENSAIRFGLGNILTLSVVRTPKFPLRRVKS